MATWLYGALALSVIVVGGAVWFRRLVKKADESKLLKEDLKALNKINKMEDDRDAELKAAIARFKSGDQS